MVTTSSKTRNLAFVTAAGCIVAGLACAPKGGPDQPLIRNVLVISSDDHAAYAVGAYGNTVIRTPNLDRLAAQGVRFESAYVNCPFCTL